ncbi:MAG TPA: histidine kinase [Thermoleophilaceae bacterium]|nr:histidine kinase [Thermoleophilaceae bacterium]
MSAAPMTPLRRALLGLGVAGIALGVPIAAITATSDHANLAGLMAVLGLVVAWSFLGTGLYAWDQRPDNLTGPLMVALAFSWLVGGLSASSSAGVYIAGSLLNALPFAILIHLLFAFPSGRLQGRWDRVFVGLGYFVTTVMPPIGILFFDPAVSEDCSECPANPLQIWNNEDVFNALVAIQSTLGAVVLGALVWHLWRRRRRAVDDPDERVRNAPVWWAGSATLLLVIAVLATNLAPEDGNFDDWLFGAALVVLATVPYAFWLGILRSKLWRADVVAVENVRLDAELQARLDELRESRARIVQAGYAERRRVERDLHDGAQQRLIALALGLRRARSALDRDPAAAAELLEAASGELEEATEELRELARGIHPPVLTDRGLVPALEALANRAPVPVRVGAPDAARAPDAVEAAAYYVVSEALTNVARHARAEQAVVRVARSDGLLRVEIEDDGVGGADLGGGSGLRGLADRVGALDGTLDVESGNGRGTVVRATLPVRPPAL